LYEFGAVVSSAFNDPKEIKKLDPTKYPPNQSITMENLPPMLRIPKRKSKASSNGE
jgi:hypothetical protein